MPPTRRPLTTTWSKREMTFVSVDGESLPRIGQTNNDPTPEDSRDTPNKDSSTVTSTSSTGFEGVTVRPL